jgi:hypothetical protein
MIRAHTHSQTHTNTHTNAHKKAHSHKYTHESAHKNARTKAHSYTHRMAQVRQLSQPASLKRAARCLKSFGTEVSTMVAVSQATLFQVL